MLILHVGCDKSIPSIHSMQPQSFEGLTHVVAFQETLFSGAKPTSNDGMHSLVCLGVKTIICVDGVTPDVEVAGRFGINTIHLPMHYSKPSQSQVIELATALKQGQQLGNVYIHCHHGKHRSATAAALASIALGQSSTQLMLDRMRVSQTSTQYAGLWEAVHSQGAISHLPLDTQFPSSVSPIGIPSKMVAIVNAMDRLRLIEQTQWKIPIGHPDLVPVADAGFIVETLRQLQLSGEANAFSDDFETRLVNAIHQAAGLEEALVQQSTPIELDQFMFAVEQSCINCHIAFRK